MPLRLAAAKAAALRQSSLEEGQLGWLRWRRQRDVAAVGDAVLGPEVADTGEHRRFGGAVEVPALIEMEVRRQLLGPLAAQNLQEVFARAGTQIEDVG